MKTLITRSFLILSLLGTGLASAQVSPTITDTRVSPSQRQVVANQDNILAVTWQVLASPAATPVVSSGALVIDPRNGSTLAVAAGPLNSVGSSPYTFSESVTISATQVDTWLSQGLQRVVLSRTFTAVASGFNRTENMTLVLNSGNLSGLRRNPTGELSISSLRLEYASGNNLAVVNQNEELKTLLTVYYSGNGLLEGRWQIADPSSSAGNPLFRTIALVRKQLSSAQRTEIPSPALPTLRSGKYLVRFCVTNRELVDDTATAVGQCPSDALLVDAAYQVDGASSEAPQVIGGLSPNQQAIDMNTAFSWQAVPAAMVYQLQIFSLSAHTEFPGTSNSAAEWVEPQFVTGMVLRAATLSTPLSELVRSKLEPGQRYLWRITAHDSAGQLIGASDEASFIYRAH